MNASDRALFHAINRWPESLAGAMRFFSEGLNGVPAKIGIAVVVIALVAAGRNTRWPAIAALLAFPVADGICNLLKHSFPIPRPCNDPALTSCILRIGATASMGTASSHAANTMAIATVFLFSLRGFGVPWLVLSILVGLSRVYNGVHYPLQVLLGWIVGATVGTLASLLLRRLTRPKSLGDVAQTPPSVQSAREG